MKKVIILGAITILGCFCTGCDNSNNSTDTTTSTESANEVVTSDTTETVAGDNDLLKDYNIKAFKEALSQTELNEAMAIAKEYYKTLKYLKLLSIEVADNTHNMYVYQFKTSTKKYESNYKPGYIIVFSTEVDDGEFVMTRSITLIRNTLASGWKVFGEGL